MNGKRVLVGCESSGTVREAFRACGFDAWSCDLLPADDGSEHHLEADVCTMIQVCSWDLIILHPPCTCLAVSGNRWYGSGQPKYSERLEAVEWTRGLWDLAKSQSTRVALENPVGVLHRMAGMPVTQYIQPYQFGHMEQKKTGLWLHNLPALKETKNVKAEMLELPKEERERIWRLPPSKDHWKIRSKTFQGIADAMAKQWGDVL